MVLLQELERFNKLIICMAKSLAELQRVRKSSATAAHSKQMQSTGALIASALALSTVTVIPGLGWGSWNEQ